MKTTFIIKGTHCASCKVLIEDLCRVVKGVQSCVVDFTTGKVVVEHDEKADWGSFKKEINSFCQYHIDSPDGGLYSCSVCGFVYATKAQAEMCKVWCAIHRSCSMEIMKQSLTH